MKMTVAKRAAPISFCATTSGVHASLGPKTLPYVLRVPIVALAILPVSPSEYDDCPSNDGRFPGAC